MTKRYILLLTIHSKSIHHTHRDIQEVKEERLIEEHSAGERELKRGDTHRGG
jgi:hypothetical protein